MKTWIAWLFCCCVALTTHAQQENQTDANGNRIGYWTIKGTDGKAIAKGYYNTSGQRHGEWKFYFSPVGRYTNTPDVVGTYVDGQKQGKWQVTESRSKQTLQGKFTDDKMEGVWVLTDKKGAKLAKGEYVNGIRNGRWIIYYDDQPLDMGLYEGGIKSGYWYRDAYLEDSSVHVKGMFSFTNTRQEGAVELFKVERHPSFGMNEVLVGTGAFLNGKKTGRWIEYIPGLKGESIETGYYAGTGEREGIWESTIDGKPHQQVTYNNGQRQGAFRAFYPNGKNKYETAYDKGLEVGIYKSYYESGQVRETGAYTILERKEIQDTIFHKIELPIEYHFRLVDLDNIEQYNYNAIKWVREPEFSIPADVLENRFQEFLSYGLSKQLRIQEIVQSTKQSVRVGKFVAYHENGKVRLEGTYFPDIKNVKDPATNAETREFTRDGEWKEYDDLGYLQYVYQYNKGELVKKTDAHGKEISITGNN